MVPVYVIETRGIGGIGITTDSLNEGKDGSKAAVLEANGDRESLLEAVAVRGIPRVIQRIGAAQVVEEETGELDNDGTKGRSGKTRDMLAQVGDIDIKT